MQTAWFSGVLALVCLAVAALQLMRLVTLRRDVAGEAAHAAMGLGMAAMFSPFGDPVPAPVWVLVFVLSGAWFAALALRTRDADATHHVVGSGAMLFMLLGGAHVPAATGGGGHVAHGGGPETGGLGVASLVAIVLAGYFVWHVLRCGDRIGRAADGPDAVPAHATLDDRGSGVGALAGVAVAVSAPVRAGLASPRAAAVAHLAMAIAMTVMLLGMV